MCLSGALRVEGARSFERESEDGEEALFVFTGAEVAVADVEHAPSRERREGLTLRVWAEHEYGGTPLRDTGLSAQLVKSARLLAAHPDRKISASGKSSQK